MWAAAKKRKKIVACHGMAAVTAIISSPMNSVHCGARFL
ncbi:hypothetical protein FHS21_003062 [Phyllobacterium trifolii]|uniref:Uncharacterized protein n=1 Tax=Phyllobacterium trifolii TaxID=300193 RepID=A0A839U690_9HYPH|nr:hypothetical protein [Phyllobacterium trifolii]